jgi:hypothetical protein
MRAHPDKPDTWQPALARGRAQMNDMRLQHRSEKYIAEMLFNTCQSVPRVHFQKFLDDLKINYHRKSW